MKFHCKKCDISTKVKQNHANCENKNIFFLEMENNKREMNGYICTICNYVQIKKSAVIRHLVTEHDETDGTKCKNITLLGKANMTIPDV